MEISCKASIAKLTEDISELTKAVAELDVRPPFCGLSCGIPYHQTAVAKTSCSPIEMPKLYLHLFGFCLVRARMPAARVNPNKIEVD